MSACCVKLCVKSANEKRTIHRFPKNEQRRKEWEKWVSTVNQSPFSSKPSSRLCNKHFLDECYREHGVLKPELKPDAVPTLMPECDLSNLFRRNFLPSTSAVSLSVLYGNNLVSNPEGQTYSPVCQATHCDETLSNSATTVCVDKSSNALLDPMPTSCFTENPQVPLDLSTRSVNEHNTPTSGPKTSSCTPKTPAERIPNKRKRYPGDMTPGDFSTPKRARRTLEFLKDDRERLNRKIRRVRESCRRKQTKVKSLTELLQHLESRGLVNRHTTLQIEEDFPPPVAALLNRGFATGKKTQVSPTLRRFALTLNYHSGSAYDYVREVFLKGLPHPKTISRWFSNINGKPGFTEEAMKTVRSQAQDFSDKGKTLLCALMVDEMAIKKGLELIGGETYGYADNGVSDKNDLMPLAGEAWVFMLVAINSHWKIPVGYFLLHSMNAPRRANMLRHALRLIHQTGAVVVSLTFDGNSVNVAMAEMLGAKMQPLQPDWNPSFIHPDGGHEVQVIMDAAHMVKLWRNVMGSRKVHIKDSDGNTIRWDFIEKLHQLQDKEGLSCGNRIGRRHIRYLKEKMKVSLATQTLSTSVADALVYCERDLRLPEFRGCGATVQFIRHADRIFDILNSRNLLARGFKGPLCERNVNNVREYCNEAKKYILGLTNEKGVPILKTIHRTGFIGFLNGMESVLKLYDLWVGGKYLQFIPTYKLSQDHLENFFCAIRGKGGFSNNPSVRKFISAYTRLLVKVELGGKRGANCWPLDNTTILHVSSRTGRRSVTGTDEVSEDEDDRLLQTHDFASPMLDTAILSQFVQDVVEYIAGFVSMSLSKTATCCTCKSALFGTITSSALLRRKNRGGLVIPSSDVTAICRKAEEELRSCQNRKVLLTSGLLKHTANIKRKLVNSNIFECLVVHTFDQEPLDNHRDSLIRQIVKKYLVIRVAYDIKKFNNSIHKERIRMHCNKTVLFQNQ